MELGGQAQTSLILNNITPLKATWALQEREAHEDSPVMNLQTTSPSSYPCDDG